MSVDRPMMVRLSYKGRYQVWLLTSAALPVHCVNHSLNLILQEAGSACILIRNALSVDQDIHNIIKLSPKRMSMFENIRHSFASESVAFVVPMCFCGHFCLCINRNTCGPCQPKKSKREKKQQQEKVLTRAS